MDLIEYPDAEMMMIDLANALAEELEECLLVHEWASFAVPGGTTPGPIFDTLCAADLDWSRVHILLTDERWVPTGSPRSNTRLVRERLLVERAAAATLIPLYADTETPEAALDALTAQVENERPISVMVLGMGTDMHTASLFPGADRLEEALSDRAPALLPMRAPGAQEARISMTMPVLKGAMSRHLVLTGADKRDALDRAQTLSPMDAPVSAILPGTTVHWAE